MTPSFSSTVKPAVIKHPTLQWDKELVPERTALLVIDMHNNFVTPGYPLYCEEGYKYIPTAKKLISLCRSKGIKIIYTRHVHRADGSDKGLMQTLEPELELKQFALGSDGLEIPKEIAPQEGDAIVDGNRYSKFINTHLDNILRTLKIEHVIMIGVALDGCCEATTRDLMQHDYKVLFLSDGNLARQRHDWGWGHVPAETVRAVVCTTLAANFCQVMTTDAIMERLAKL
jgi:ureidoacrylate peracid hydrolase